MAKGIKELRDGANSNIIYMFGHDIEKFKQFMENHPELYSSYRQVDSDSDGVWYRVYNCDDVDNLVVRFDKYKFQF